MNKTERCINLVNKVAQYPAGHAKRRRVVRRCLRIYAAHWRALPNGTAHERAYERAARKF